MIEIYSFLIGTTLGITAGLFMGKIEQLIFKYVSTEKQKFARLEKTFKTAQSAYTKSLLAKIYTKGSK
jgi:hypothetical protein